MKKGKIRIGIGGWTFEPWRNNFYPAGLPHARELEYASRQLTAIEINGTFYRTQTPATFEKWASETPDSFMFTLKAPRYAVNRRELSEAGQSIERFLESGLDQLGSKLGPILWQFPPTRKFDEAAFAAFLKLLPKDYKGHKLRHALEVRHDSFHSSIFAQMAADMGVAVVIADSDDYPLIETNSGGFVYARLMKSRTDEPSGYSETELKSWASRAAVWSASGLDTFIFFIDGAKERAPAAALAFLKLLPQT
jgi:uncharacterized protein YecE (DUF72 family)